MLKDLRPGDVFPDFELPDEDGEPHRLSELQGDDVMVLMLGRGEHCPRERQHLRELLRFHEWSAVAFTQMVTVLPNGLHDVYKLKISTGASWRWLSSAAATPGSTRVRTRRWYRPASSSGSSSSGRD